MSAVARALLAELSLDDLAELARKLEPFLPRQDAPGGWLTTAGAATHLGISVHSLHRLTAERRIPFAQDTPGGKCFFRRCDLDQWRAAAP